MTVKIAKIAKFPETRVGPAGQLTSFGRNLEHLRRLKVGFSEKFARALENPTHTLTRFLSEFDLEKTISCETSRLLTGLTGAFEEYCHEYDLTRTQCMPGGHREVAEYEIVFQELNPPIRGRRFVLDIEEPELKDKPEVLLAAYPPRPAIDAEAIATQLFEAEGLFLDKRPEEALILTETALDDMREGDFKPLDRIKTLEAAAVMFVGMNKQVEGLELLEEMFTLFSDPRVEQFSLPRFFDTLIGLSWVTGHRQLAYRAIDLNLDIATEMITFLEMGESNLSLIKDFAPVPQQLRTIRNMLEEEPDGKAENIKTRIGRLLARLEDLDNAKPERKGLPN